MPPPQRDDRYQPLALLGVTLVALVGFAVFFVSFLVAPLAILLIFYVGFAMFDRSRRRRNANRQGDGTPAAEPVERRRPSTPLGREVQVPPNVVDRANAQDPMTTRPADDR